MLTRTPGAHSGWQLHLVYNAPNLCLYNDGHSGAVVGVWPTRTGAASTPLAPTLFTTFMHVAGCCRGLPEHTYFVHPPSGCPPTALPTGLPILGPAPARPPMDAQTGRHVHPSPGPAPTPPGQPGPPCSPFGCRHVLQTRPPCHYVTAALRPSHHADPYCGRLITS